ncbi:toll/interleukin-1 receptor domain-containing protein [Streptomyces sp. DSM 118148]|uniref:toll/interleukin-1 receptor domain-containing protein n=1 Tax=Streptomyces sp. DSM 118148 TaxID=3448667 RepID=UPI00403FD10A
MGKRPAFRSAEEVVEAYKHGHRDFSSIKLTDADFSRSNLRGASFLSASLKGANFADAYLTHTQFKAADLEQANFSRAAFNATDLIGASFVRAIMFRTDLTGAALNRADLTGADLRYASLGNARITDAALNHALCEGIRLSSTNLADTDVRVLCDTEKIRHGGPSNIDARTVMKSYKHPRLKRFMGECGVPSLFAEYMIDCARALGESLIRNLMQTTFISYGGPDEVFARRLYETLKEHGIVAFFFPESATLGERIDNEIYRRLAEHDRVILICSEASLNRPGVLHEIQETFDRESRDGGATYLLPIMLDDYVVDGWKEVHPVLAERVNRRVVGDFRRAAHSRADYDTAVGRLINALKTARPSV